ncbi:MAG: tryptophan--tRNA ligase [Thermoplasmata archaeon]
MAEEFVVTPWEVRGEIDYNKLIDRFGTQRVDEGLLERIRSLAGEIHPLLTRGVFYSHRDMDWILDEYEKGYKFYLYTGRGPSSQVHVGHLIPWVFTRWLQDTLDVRLYFQITDDEKFLFRDFGSLEESTRVGYENVLDIIALGFDPRRTRVIFDTKLIRRLYPLALRVARRITFSTVKAVFGFTPSSNVGEIFYTSIQAVPCFLESVRQGRNVPCLIPCGIDQDPHFRIARDVAPHLGYYKPALIHNKLMPSLEGMQAKMSASSPTSAIFLTEELETAREHVMDAVTGGGATVEEHRKYGGKPEICPVYHHYAYFFEWDDDRLKEVYDTCRSGARLCGDCKAELGDKVVSFLANHQEKREKARDRIHEFVMTEEELDGPGPG